MFNIDLHKVIELFKYNPKAPLIFSSGFFLFLFLGFALVYFLLRRQDKARIIYVILFSCYFYYKSSGFFFGLLFISAALDFSISWLIHHNAQKPFKRKLFLIISIVGNLGMLCYFKYTNFFGELICDITHRSFTHLDIFLPVGISFFTFQSMSYTIDVYRKNLSPVKSFLDYCFYVSFFPQILAGPIVRAKDFLPQIHRPLVVTKEMFGTGVFLIITGLFKKAIISDYISINFIDRIFDNPALYTGVENLMGIYAYAIQIYCDFSGYSDMAIGLALILGFHFNINFDSPYKSSSITEFWRRWHISLSSWLRDYLYISLGGNRKGKFRTYLNLFITMLLGGLWHGASLKFVCWGALHGVSLAIHKLMMSIFPSMKHSPDKKLPVWRKFIGIIFTFHLVCFGWLFFRSNSFELAIESLQRIFTAFHPEVFMQLIQTYTLVFSLLLLGFLLHFAPKKWEDVSRRIVIEMPLILKALAIVAVIIFVMQIKSADIQPFIYFQF